jgi:hypothetical protein
MIATKTKPKATTKAPKPAPVARPVKMLVPKVAEAKHIGPEPTWEKIGTRKAQLIAAFNWYNYSYGAKDAKEMIADWLSRNDREKDAKKIRTVPDNEIRVVIGWLCRVSVVGLDLSADELETVNKDIGRLLAFKEVKKKEAAASATPKPTIQDRLREKLSECAGELEGMYDEFLLSGCKMSADFKPLNLFRQFNVAPPMIGEINKIWEKKLGELKEIYAGKDQQLVEGYGCYGKIQIRNMIKFAETVVADCGSYVQLKKVEKKPRVKKAVPPERIAAKLKYLPADTALGIKSEAPAKLVGCTEAWLFDTKKRKLMHYVADAHIGSMTVKNNSLIGFDTAASSQKTVRKPEDTLKGVMGSRPAARKNYAEINAVEAKLTGRFAETILILKVY